MKDLNIEGKKYISTKRASELSGYTSDYIGQLSRGGFVKSTIIGKTKFVDEEELLKYIEIVKNNKLLHKNGNGNAETIKSQNHPSEIFFGFHGASKISKSEYAHENINNENKINYSTDESPLFPELKKKNFFTEISKNNGPLTRSPFLSQENFVSDTFFKKIISACLAIVVVFGPYTFLKTQYAIAGWNKIKTVAGNTLEIGKEIAQKINKDGVIILVTDSVGYTKDLLKNETRRIAINTASTILSTDVKSTQFSLKNIAKGIYLSINSLFTKTKTTETTQLVKNVETNLPIQTGKSQNPTPSPTIVQIQQPTKTIVIEGPTKIVERVLERTSVIGVSKEELEARIQQLDNKLSSKIYNVSSGTPNSVQTVYDVVSQTNRIDKLRNVEITTPTIVGGTLKDSVISNSSFSGTTISASTLTLTGNATIGGQLTVSGGIATSTIAGDVNFDTGTLFIDSLNNRIGIASTSPNATFSVNGDSYVSGTGFFGGAINSTSTITGTTLVATSNSATSTFAGGLNTFGLAIMNFLEAPFLTATSTTATSTFAGGLAIETSGLVYDYSTNNVGIGTATPTALLHVSGTTIIGNSTLSQAFQFGTLGANSPALANANVTMSASNYALSTDGTSQTIINAPANIDFRIANSVIGKITATNGYFNGSGNFGIGTTSPYAKLSVVGPVVAEYFNATSTTATSTFAGGLQAGTNNALTIEGGATANSLYVKTNGNVGIGTTSPYAKLSVWGSGTGATEMANFTNSASTTVMSILNNGNVGIGTTGPTSVLHVPILSSGQTAAIGTAKFISPGDQDANGLMNAITLYNAAGTQKASIGYRQNDLGGLYIGGGNGGDTANLQFGGSQFKLNTNGGAGISFTGGDGIGFTFGFGTSALQKVNFNNDGNVGIGTTAPGEKLSVAGVIESTTGGFKFPDGTTQITASTGGIDPTTTSELMDDFIGGNTSSGTISQYGWKWTTGGSGTITYTSAESGRVGLVKGKSGTTTNNGSTLYLVDPANQPIFPSSFGNLTIIFSIKQVDANSSSNMQIGTADNIALIGDVNNGAYFRSSGSGNWYAITRSGAIETATDTGVAQASSFKQFKIVINSNYTSIAFYIDNVLKATHTTNLPSGNLSPRVQIVTTSGTDYSFDIDYFYYKATGLSRADIAENYTVEDLSIESGDLVKIKEDQNPLIGKYVVEKTSKPYDSKIMGTISTEPAMILGEKGKENLRPIALIGRVPIKVSTKNGEILAGDYLTSSDIPGVAMKSTKPGMTIGKALESYSSSSPDEIGKIMVFVNPHWSIGSVEETSTSTLGGYFSLPSEILAKISLFFNEIITKVENGIAYMKALVVDTLEIGSPTKPTGVTVYDKNGQAGCLEVQDVNNGTVSVKPGKCDQQVEAPTPDTSSGGDITPPASDTPSENTDITPPVITLNGTSPVVLIVGDIYNEEGAIVTDDVDTDIALIISGTVDTNTAGSYTITYTATDTAGNTVSTTRIVNVETTAPTPETPIEVPPETPPETLLIQ
ncbi:MAG: hypothetical protein Athens071416_365 [Parcubacteria group bacterium Athens0714_16]|nr:MAG: hypothetical protein Athens071416_365 [Parcubacteria group bacterium Athens0714_16]